MLQGRDDEGKMKQSAKTRMRLLPEIGAYCPNVSIVLSIDRIQTLEGEAPFRHLSQTAHIIAYNSGGRVTGEFPDDKLDDVRSCIFSAPASGLNRAPAAEDHHVDRK